MTAEQPRHDAGEPDPLVGDEIIRISLKNLAVYIDLNRSQVQIKSDFLVRYPGHVECKVLQESRSADMSALWSSVGGRIASVTWGHNLIVEVDNGVQIIVPPSLFGSRGPFFRLRETNTFGTISETLLLALQPALPSSQAKP